MAPAAAVHNADDRPAIQHGDSTWTHASFASARSHLPDRPVDPLAPDAANLSRIEGVEHDKQAAPAAAVLPSSSSSSERTVTVGEDEQGAPKNKDAQSGDGKEETKTDEDGNEYIEVGWEGPDDPQNPQNWPASRKWRATLLATLLTINVTFASSAPSVAVEMIAADYQIGQVTATLIVSIFLAGYCLGPLLWSTMSEIYGRRKLFIISGVLYTVFIIPQPLAPNAPALFITRFISGVAAACPLSNAGGLIADVHSPYMRGVAMSLFSVSVFLGPCLGPIIASFIIETRSWQLIFWVMLAFAGFSVVLIALFLEETLAPVLLAQKAQRLRKQDPTKYANHYAPAEKVKHTIKSIVEKDLIRPFHILALEPILVLITIYLSIVYGILYGTFEAFPIIWQETRGFSPGLSSLMYVGVLIGTTTGGAINIWFNQRFKPLQVLWRGTVPPEERLWGAVLAGPLLVVSLFWLGWTGNYPQIPWYVPALATIPLGIAFTLTFISFLSYIVDAYMQYAASALAANTIFRSAVGAAFPLFSRQMFTGLHINWAASLLGFVALVLAPSPLLFYCYGEKIREWSRFAPAKDIQIRQDLEKEGILPKDSRNALLGEAKHGLKAAKRVAAEEQQKNGTPA